MKKVILVTFPAWRCGSSMVTSLLEKCGADLGRYNVVKSLDNPNGSFENISMVPFQHALFDSHWNMFGRHKNRDEMDYISKVHAKCFASLLLAEFSNSKTVAFKSLSGCMVPFVNKNENYDARIIFLHRNNADQALSLTKVHDGCTTINPKILDWVKKSEEWHLDYLKETKTDYLDVKFESILDNPIEETQRICEYVGLPIIEDDVIKKHVIPKWARSRTNLDCNNTKNTKDVKKGDLL